MYIEKYPINKVPAEFKKIEPFDVWEDCDSKLNDVTGDIKIQCPNGHPMILLEHRNYSYWIHHTIRCNECENEIYLHGRDG